MKKFIILILSLILSGCTPDIAPAPIDITEELQVHYIDVGQADCSLIVTDEDTMLIDGGNVSDSSLVVSYLRKLNIDELDYVICTHAHEDHVGGLSGPLNAMEVHNVYAPKTEADTKAYKNFKKASPNITHPKPGDKISLGESTITFLAPINEDTDNVNNTSIVLKLEFGETSFLFTGDCEYEEETDILNSGYDLSATVLKVGHHGSSTSTSYRFLREIMPKFAVIQVGTKNDYGHPHNEVLSRLEDADVKVFRNDTMGDIIATSDGETVTFETKKNTDNTSDYQYIGNRNSKKFHTVNCSSLPKKENRVYFQNKEDAIESGYSPCGGCLAIDN